MQDSSGSLVSRADQFFLSYAREQEIDLIIDLDPEQRQDYPEPFRPHYGNCCTIVILIKRLKGVLFILRSRVVLHLNSYCLFFLIKCRYRGIGFSFD